MIGSKMFAFFAFCFIAGTFLSGVMEGQATFGVTKLSAAISATDLTIPVDSTLDFQDIDGGHPYVLVYIENERVKYTSKDVTNFYLPADGRGLSAEGEGEVEAYAHSEDAKVKSKSASIINSLMQYDIASTSSTFGTLKAGVGLGMNMIKSIPRMITWNYSYLDGRMVMIKYFVLYPISIGFVWGLTITFMSAVTGIFRR